MPEADILINNAGGILRGNLLQLDDGGWRQAWELKVFGYINMSRAFYRAMCERRAGVIVNVIGIAAESISMTTRRARPAMPRWLHSRARSAERVWITAYVYSA